jgi:sugar lactone lactonase YvrE
MMQVFDDRACALGEGPLWHPLRRELFWFDILGKRLLSKSQDWSFDEHVSAAGWVDEDTLLVASETGLWRFSISSGARECVIAMEADNPVTRSNDGRADPFGGFWIGTMGKAMEKGAGAIYRYYRGELRRIVDGITVSNSICFAPDGQLAYFADTATRTVQCVRLSASDGWPIGEPKTFLDLRADNLRPDGSVVDADGNLWNAQWGAARVAVYSPEGALRKVIAVPASQSTCPAFGGADLDTLYVTSAADGVDESDAGKTFMQKTDAKGQAEHQVIL